MVLDQVYADILRAAHLSCFAAGMGTALYHEYRTLRTINNPISVKDIDTVKRLHDWITLAFIGLWMTGIALIYVRTAFDLAAFSPKLWVKMCLMVLMSFNAMLIGIFVVPLLKQNIGRPVVELPCRALSLSSQVAIVSMFCWTSGLALGSSAYLKTAPWDVLLPLFAGWFAVCTIGGQVLIGCMRLRVKSASQLEAR
ncbi:MAG: hypothetical protein WA790_17900 [Sulfitobacter sp.]